VARDTESPRRWDGATKSGAIKMHVTEEVLARVPRDELEAIEMQNGKLVSVLKLRFTNGVLWEFDIPRTAKKNAKQLVAALGGTVI
jgi:formate-dependent nitrite reductase cytochrome c552 subunit